MRIEAMHITPLAMADPPLRNAAGLHAPYALRIVLELVTDDGVSGLGELPGGAAMLADLERVRDLVVGHNPFELNALSLLIEQRFTRAQTRRAARVFGGVEVACLDIIGKALGRPVVDLLGGKVRDRVPFAAYLFFKHEGAGGPLGFGCDPEATGWDAVRQAEALDPAGVVAQAQAMCATFGFTSLKLKAGTLEPAVEVATIFALREAFGPDWPLRIDPNGVWSVETAIAWGKQMAGVLEYYEDPVRGQEQMAEVARTVSMPLATNMCTTAFEDLPSSIRLSSEQIILMDHHVWGGLRASLDLARICRTFGRELSMHSNSHLGISLAAMIHLGAAVPNLAHACDTHYPWQTDEVIAGGRFQFEDGSVAVPAGPGLGIELDRNALAALHRNYQLCGLTERDDQLAMQQVEPGWEFIPTRW